jgi:hypothetical protein
MLQASHIRQTCASGRCWRGARLVVLECHVLAPGTSILRADVAQLVEQLIRNQQVTRSSRVVGSTIPGNSLKTGRPIVGPACAGYNSGDGTATTEDHSDGGQQDMQDIDRGA